MKYLVFVDFDGVLTSNRVSFPHTASADYPLWATFDPVVMEFFNKINDTYDDVSFVWTTSWRYHLKDSAMLDHILHSMWYNAGFRGKLGKPWRVNPNNRNDDDVNFNDRAKEINDYLKWYAPDHKDFIVFDDSDYDYNRVLGIKRFIKTDADDGMLFRHMRRAWGLIGHWDKRT